MKMIMKMNINIIQVLLVEKHIQKEIKELQKK